MRTGMLQLQWQEQALSSTRKTSPDVGVKADIFIPGFLEGSQLAFSRNRRVVLKPDLYRLWLFGSWTVGFSMVIQPCILGGRFVAVVGSLEVDGADILLFSYVLAVGNISRSLSEPRSC
jgi:hypothetical protein